MYPTIFEIGPLTLKSFGLMAAMGFFFAYLAIKKIALRKKMLSSDDVAQFLVVIMLGGAFGARFAYVAEHWKAEFASLPFSEIFRFDKGGLMFYGGLIGAIFAIYLFSRARKIALVKLLDIAAFSLPLGHFFGRVGCFLNGCCYGKVCDSIISVTYPQYSNPWADQVHQGLISKAHVTSLPILPSQLIESVLNLVLFFVLYNVAKKDRPDGFVAGCYLISYAIIRIFTETLRSDPRLSFGAFSIAQTISLILLPIGLAFILYAKRRKAQ